MKPRIPSKASTKKPTKKPNPPAKKSKGKKLY